MNVLKAGVAIPSLIYVQHFQQQDDLQVPVNTICVYVCTVMAIEQ